MSTPAPIQALLDGAKCFKCLPTSIQLDVQTYIIAYVAGLGTDPNTLAALAKDLVRLNRSTLLEIKAYLLARIAGFSTDPNVLAEQVKCYECIPDGFMSEVQTYLLSIDPNGPLITDTNELANAAKCIRCLPQDTQLQVQVYLLATLAGLSTDPNDLAELAKCMKCLSQPVLQNVTIDALNEVEIVTGGGISGGGGVPCTDYTILLDNGNYGTNPLGDNNVLITFDATATCVIDDFQQWVVYCCNEDDGSDGVEITWYAPFPAPPATGGPYTDTLAIPLPFPPFYRWVYVTMRRSDMTESPRSNLISMGDPVQALTEANTWAAEVVANGGGPVSAETITCVANTFRDLYGYLIRDRINAMNLFVPDDAIAAMTPQIHVYGSNPWIYGNAVGPGFGTTYLSRHGYRADAATYINPGINPTLAPIAQNNHGVSYYLMDVGNFSGAPDWGGRAGDYFMGFSYPDRNIYFDSPNNGGAGRTSGAAPAWPNDVLNGYWRGFISMSRTGAANTAIYAANSTNGFSTVKLDNKASAALPNIGIFINGLNDAGSWFGGVNRTYSAFIFHEGFQGPETQMLWLAIERCRECLGGGYIPLITSGVQQADEWANKTVQIGGAMPSDASRAAIATFWDALVAANIHKKMLYILPYAPDSLSAATVPVANQISSVSAQNVNFVAGDLTINGLLGVPASATSLRIGVRPSDLPFDAFNYGFSEYVHTWGSSTDCGATSGGFATAIALQLLGPPSTCYWDPGNPATDRIGVAMSANPFTGFVSVNRLAANNKTAYDYAAGGSWQLLGTNVFAGADVRAGITAEIGAHGLNVAGAWNSSNKRISFWALHNGLTSTEGEALRNAVQALRVAFGGGFV